MVPAAVCIQQGILTFSSQTGYAQQISVIQFFLVKINISDIPNAILLAQILHCGTATISVYVKLCYHHVRAALGLSYRKFTKLSFSTIFSLGKPPMIMEQFGLVVMTFEISAAITLTCQHCITDVWVILTSQTGYTDTVFDILS